MEILLKSKKQKVLIKKGLKKVKNFKWDNC